MDNITASDAVESGFEPRRVHQRWRKTLFYAIINLALLALFLYVVLSSLSFTVSISKNTEFTLKLKNFIDYFIEGEFLNMVIEMNFLGLNGFDGDSKGIRKENGCLS